MTRHESNGELKWRRWRKFCQGQNYGIAGVFVVWFGFLMATAAGPVGWGLNLVIVCYYTTLLFNKWRWTSGYRKTEENDLRGADCSPPYITKAGRITYLTDSVTVLDPSTGERADYTIEVPGEVPGESSGKGVAPDYFEPLIGYRAWTVVDGVLRGLAVDTWTWTRDINVAGCDGHRIGRHVVGSSGCYCGFWAFKSFKLSVKRLWMPPRFFYGGTIFGKIEMFGTVTEHDDGYRASHARIVEFYGSRWSSDLRKIAKRYDVPLKRWPNPELVRKERNKNGLWARIWKWLEEM